MELIGVCGLINKEKYVIYLFRFLNFYNEIFVLWIEVLF